MQKFYHLSLLFVAVFFIRFDTHAQSVSGVEVAIVGDNLQVTYSMAGLRSGQKFDVELYSSIDNYAAPLINDRIIGDLGKGITLKPGNLITIGDPLETLGAITSDLNFKIRVTMIYNPVEIIDPTSYFEQKRDKDFNVTWTGGLGGEQVKFDLYLNNQLIRDDFFTTVNNKSAEFKFPKVELGSGYTMAMQFESLSNDVMLPDFSVKRKKSIAGRVIKISLLLLAADFAWYAASGEPGTFEDINQLNGFIFRNFDASIFQFVDPNRVVSLPDPPSTPDQFSRTRFNIISFNFN